MKKDKFLKKLVLVLCMVSITIICGAVNRVEAGVAADLTAVTVDVIVGIDKESRTITLKKADDTEWVFTAGPEVRNFDQLKRGDLVMMEFYSGLAVALGQKDTGITASVSDVNLERSEPGEKPGMKITDTTLIIAQVADIDIPDRLVTLQGVDNAVVLKVSDDIDLSKIAVGQEVHASYIQSYAISVVQAPKVSGTVTLETKSLALGVGAEWGSGTLTMYNGTTHNFKISGLSVMDIGATSIEAAGEVYNLVEAKDLEGTFITGEVGAAFFAGGSAIAMKNEHGVVLKLKSTQKGLKLTLAGKGMKIMLQ